MTVLSDLPCELDPGYVAPEETIEEMIRPRRPEVGGWVNCSRLNNGGQPDMSYNLAQVLEVREGDFLTGGCFVRPWLRTHMAFGEAFFAPWNCITSRAAVTRYSLTGEVAADLLSV